MLEKSKENWNQKKTRSLLLMLAFGAILVILTLILGQQIVSTTSNPVAFKAWIDSYGIWGKFILVGLMLLQVLIAFIPGEMIEIGAGYAFGPLEGSFLCLVGATLGSAIILWLVKKFGIKMVEYFVPKEKNEGIQFLQNEKKLNLLVFTIFFIPGTPKDLLTYFVGLTKMKISTFIFITFFARIPSVITSTFGGNALMEKNYKLAIVTFTVTLVISGTGLFIYNQMMTAKRRQYIKAK